MSKICSKCKVEKDTKLFHKSTKTSSRCQPSCKDCRNSLSKSDGYRSKHRLQAQQWRKNNPIKEREIYIKYKYKISPNSYQGLLIKQNGTCAICKQICTVNPNLSVDHCHLTKKVRGLLCDRCNKGLGFFKDNPDLLIEANKYLQKGN
jgi:hypothetical protein